MQNTFDEERIKVVMRNVIIFFSFKGNFHGNFHGVGYPEIEYIIGI